MRQNFENPTSGCVFTKSSRFTGMYRLRNYVDEEQLETLFNIPGVMKQTHYRTGQVFVYIPRSIVDAGRRPALLQDYQPESCAETPSGLVLHDYEARAVTFLRTVHRGREGAMLVADPGLGKTITALHALWLDGYLSKRGLILGPNIAKGVWCDPDSDATQHYGMNVIPLEGVKNIDSTVLEKHQFYFCHFEIIYAWAELIYAKLKPSWIIIDESHLLLHGKVGMSKRVRNIAMSASVDRRYALTGTAIPNKRLDLWNQLAIVQPRQWGFSQHDFGVRYCAGYKEENNFGAYWNYDGESRDVELKARLAGTYLRYTTDEVGDGLPELERHAIEVECTDELLWDEYSKAQIDIKGYLKDKNKLKKDKLKIGSTEIKVGGGPNKAGANRLVCLTTLISLVSKMKIASVLPLVDSILQKHDQLVIFTWLRETTEDIVKVLTDTQQIGNKTPAVFGPIHGKMDLKKRKEKARQFAAEQCSIYVATMRSAGTSINSLSSASAVLFVDLYWNTTALHQAENRVRRDGCPHSKVDMYYLLLKGTSDDLFMHKLKEKSVRAANIAEHDKASVTLVQDLIPDKQEENANLDLLCERLLDDDEDEWY